MPEKQTKPKGFENMNATQKVAGTCIVSAGVLLLLLDGGAHLIFSAIAGTSAYLIHNMAVDDIPADLKKEYSDEMSDLAHSDKTILMGASVLAALGVVINPWIGVPALAASLLYHLKMQNERWDELHDLAEGLGMA